MFVFRSIFRFLFAGLVHSCILMGLLGCAGQVGVLKDTLGLVWMQGEQDHTLAQTLNPNLRYLRVTVDGRSVLLVLGYVESDLSEIWYSGQGEVLKLKHGRVVGTTGMPVDWLAVRYEGLLAWSSLMDMAESKHYQRTLDMKTNYQFGVIEKVKLEAIAKPTGQTIVGTDRSGASMVWFRESYQASKIPPSLFAVSAGQSPHVVYSRQCLSPTFCLTIQPWSLDDHGALVALAKGKLKANSQ